MHCQPSGNVHEHPMTLFSILKLTQDTAPSQYSLSSTLVHNCPHFIVHIYGQCKMIFSSSRRHPILFYNMPFSFCLHMCVMVPFSWCKLGQMLGTNQNKQIEEIWIYQSWANIMKSWLRWNQLSQIHTLRVLCARPGAFSGAEISTTRAVCDSCSGDVFMDAQRVRNHIPAVAWHPGIPMFTPTVVLGGGFLSFLIVFG